MTQYICTQKELQHSVYSLGHLTLAPGDEIRVSEVDPEIYASALAEQSTIKNNLILLQNIFKRTFPPYVFPIEGMSSADVEFDIFPDHSYCLRTKNGFSVALLSDGIMPINISEIFRKMIAGECSTSITFPSLKRIFIIDLDNSWMEKLDRKDPSNWHQSFAEALHTLSPEGPYEVHYHTNGHITCGTMKGKTAFFSSENLTITLRKV